MSGHMSDRFMDLAFGKQMLEGTHEWSDVPEVFRASLLLLQREMRRLRERLRAAEARQPLVDDPSALALEQMKLTDARVELMAAQVQRLEADVEAAKEKWKEELKATQKELMQCWKVKLKKTLIKVYKNQHAGQARTTDERKSEGGEQACADTSKRLAVCEQHVRKLSRKVQRIQEEQREKRLELKSDAPNVTRAAEPVKTSDGVPRSRRATENLRLAMEGILKMQQRCAASIATLQDDLQQHDNRLVEHSAKIQQQINQLRTLPAAKTESDKVSVTDAVTASSDNIQQGLSQREDAICEDFLSPRRRRQASLRQRYHAIKSKQLERLHQARPTGTVGVSSTLGIY